MHNIMQQIRSAHEQALYHGRVAESMLAIDCSSAPYLREYFINESKARQRAMHYFTAAVNAYTRSNERKAAMFFDKAERSVSDAHAIGMLAISRANSEHESEQLCRN